MKALRKADTKVAAKRYQQSDIRHPRLPCQVVLIVVFAISVVNSMHGGVCFKATIINQARSSALGLDGDVLRRHPRRPVSCRCRHREIS